MITIEQIEIYGMEAAIRSMRNPMNSWDKSDSRYFNPQYSGRDGISDRGAFTVGPNDLALANKLAMAGTEHAKYRGMIMVWCDILAPLYWWKEFDTYKVGVTANSCSTMHKIHDKEFTLDDFSHEHLFRLGANVEFDQLPKYNGEFWDSTLLLEMVIKSLNHYRRMFLETKDKAYWWQIIQLLPSSYNQKRAVCLNYEILSHMYRQRHDHKLDEWWELCKWIEGLPYAKEMITCPTMESTTM